MNKLKYILYCFIVFSFLGRAVTLEETIKENLYRNPQIKVSIQNYKASFYELKRVMGEKRPTLNLSGELGKERTKVDYSFNGSRQLTEHQLLLSGRYNLFDGDELKHKIGEKESALTLAKNQLLQKVNKISFSIIEVYLQLLWKKSLLEIEEENYQNHLETLEKVKIRLQAGDGYESDYRQTKARVKLAQLNRVLAQRLYREAKIRYRRLVKDSPSISLMRIPRVNFYFDDKKVEAFISKAYHNNFTLQAQKSQQNISRELYFQEKSSSYPTVDLELSQSWNNNVHGFKGGDSGQKVALVFNYNLYDGGVEHASQLSALKRSEMEQESLEDIKLMVAEEIRLALMKYKVLEEQIALSREQLSYLDGTRELYELEYQNSKRTIIDLLNIKQEYIHAKAQQVNSTFEQLLSYYQFKSVMGELTQLFRLDELLEMP